MIIADENIPIKLIEKLAEFNIKTYSIFEKARGATDKEIIDLAQNLPGIILTEDKDFGDLVFAYNQDKVSVVLLRYHYSDYQIIEENLIDFLQNYSIEQHSFIVITSRNIRIRKY